MFPQWKILGYLAFLVKWHIYIIEWPVKMDMFVARAMSCASFRTHKTICKCFIVMYFLTDLHEFTERNMLLRQVEISYGRYTLCEAARFLLLMPSTVWLICLLWAGKQNISGPECWFIRSPFFWLIHVYFTHKGMWLLFCPLYRLQGLKKKLCSMQWCFFRQCFILFIISK